MEQVDPVETMVREFAEHLREMAHKGARPSQMLYHVREKSPQEDSVFAFRCFSSAFQIRVRDGLIIDRWRGFGGHESDEEVDRVLGRWVAAYREGKVVELDDDD